MSKPIAHFGMVADLHYAERPHGIDDPGQRCFNDAPENNSYAEVTLYDSGRIVVTGFAKASSADFKKGV